MSDQPRVPSSSWSVFKSGVKSAAKTYVRTAAAVARPVGSVAGRVSGYAAPVADAGQLTMSFGVSVIPVVGTGVAAITAAASALASASRRTMQAADLAINAHFAINGAGAGEDQPPSMTPSLTDLLFKMLNGPQQTVRALIEDLGFGEDKVQQVFLWLGLGEASLVIHVQEANLEGALYEILYP